MEMCFLLQGPANPLTGNKPPLPMVRKAGGPQNNVCFVEKGKILTPQRLGLFSGSFRTLSSHCSDLAISASSRYVSAITNTNSTQLKFQLCQNKIVSA
jgi:hypothetical protein